jgi:serine/threonine-protein kinase
MDDPNSEATAVGQAFLRKAAGDWTGLANAPAGTALRRTTSPGPPATSAPSVEGVALLELASDLEVGRALGEGGMGIVSLARQRSLDRSVAVKGVRAEAATPAAQAALIDEGRVTGSLEHPNIVPVHALGRGPDGRPVIVMKRIEGVSWPTLLDQPDHPLWVRLEARTGDRLAAGIEILVAVCDALGFAHARGIVHRDVKPENVMLGEHGEVYLVDWGIACRVGGPPVAELVGTPAYLAPEMLDPDTRRVGPRTDVYLLGGVLHRLLTGRPPHGGATVTEALGRALLGVTLEVADERQRALVALARAALARAPELRPPSVDAVREGLVGWLRRREALALGQSALARVSEVEALAAEVDAGRASPARLEQAALACRVEFSLALRAWPENPEVVEGWCRCRLRLFDSAMVRDQLEAAEGLLDELREAGAEPARLEAGAVALRARREALRADAAAAEGGRRLARELDERVSRGERTWFWGVLLGSTSVVLALILARGGLAAVSVLETAFLAAGVDAALLGAAFLGRRAMLANAFNRRMTWVVLWSMTALVLHRFAAYGAGEQRVEAVLVGDLWILAGITGTAALAVQPLFGVVACGFGLSAVAAARWPAFTLELFAGAPVVTVVAAMVAHGRSLRRRG